MKTNSLLLVSILITGCVSTSTQPKINSHLLDREPRTIVFNMVEPEVPQEKAQDVQEPKPKPVYYGAKKGDTGEHIRVLQARLNHLNYNLPESIYYRTMTDNAVKSFQAVYDIEEDGVLDETTEKLEMWWNQR